MNDLKILIGNIIKNVRTNDTYRVIYIGNGYIGLCKINTNKIEIDYPTAKGLGLNIRNNLFEIITDEPDIFDESIIPADYEPIYNERKELVKAVTSEYGPSFMGLIGKKKKPIITSFIQNSHMGKTQIWDVIRKYLQSGFQNSSLMDQRYFRKVSNEYTYKNKPGRKPKDVTINKGKRITAEDTKNFKIFIIPMKTWCMHSVRLTTICCPIMNTRISAIGIRLMPLKTAQKSCYGVSSRKIIENLSEGRNTSCLFVLSKMRFMENAEEELLADGTVGFIRKTDRNRGRRLAY